MLEDVKIITANEVNAINSINLIRSIENHYSEIPVKEAINDYANTRKYAVYSLDIPGKVEPLRYEHFLNTRNWFSSEEFQTLLYGDLIGLIRERDPETKIDYISGKEFIRNKEAKYYIVGAAALGIENVIERFPSQMSKWNRTKEGKIIINIQNYFKIAIAHKPQLKKVFPEALNYHLGVFDAFAYLCGTHEFKTKIVKEESDYNKHYYTFEAHYRKRGLIRRIKTNVIRNDSVVREMFSALEQATIDAAAQNRKTIEQNFEARRKLQFASKQLPPNVANEIIIEGKEPKISSEEKYRTNQVTDIRDFTTKTEGFKDLAEFLRLYFRTVSPQIIKNNGQIDKLIGDSVLSRYRFAGDAVNAAISIMEELRNLNSYTRKEKIFPGVFPIYTGIGMATGFVEEGYFGDENFMQFTDIGDSVTLASRLENLTKTYNVPILIDDRTFVDLRDANLLAEIEIPLKYDEENIKSVIREIEKQRKQGLIFSRQIDLAKPKGKEHKVGIYEIMNSYETSILVPKLKTQEDFNLALGLFQAKREKTFQEKKDALEEAKNLFQKINISFQEEHERIRCLTSNSSPEYKPKGEFICQQKIKIINNLLSNTEKIEKWSGIPTFLHK